VGGGLLVVVCVACGVCCVWRVVCVAWWFEMGAC